MLYGQRYEGEPDEAPVVIEKIVYGGPSKMAKKKRELLESRRKKATAPLHRKMALEEYEATYGSAQVGSGLNVDLAYLERW